MASSIKISSETHEMLKRETLRVSGLLGVRLTLETVLIGLLKLNANHPAELESILKSER